MPFNEWDDWDPVPYDLRTFDSWKSPSGKFSAVILKTDDKESGRYIMKGRVLSTEKEVTLGYGYSKLVTTAKWIAVNGSDILVMERQLWPVLGWNELLIVRPAGDGAWDLIYKTPAFWATTGDSVPGQCHWELLGVDEKTGCARLKVSWRLDAPANAKPRPMQSRSFDVPLFYSTTANAH